MFKSNEAKVALPAIIIFWYFYSLQWTSLQQEIETNELSLQYFSVLKYGYLHDRVITNSYKFQHTWRNSSYNTSSVTFSDKLPHQTVLSSSILQPNRREVYDLYLLRMILAQQLTSYLNDLINLAQRSKTWYIHYPFFWNQLNSYNYNRDDKYNISHLYYTCLGLYIRWRDWWFSQITVGTGPWISVLWFNPCLGIPITDYRFW